MTDQGDRNPSGDMRFEATVHPTTSSAELAAVEALDLDRVPDPEGGMRMLLAPDDLARLVAEGYEVHVHAVAPVTPLDPDLVADDADTRQWFEEMTRDATGDG